MTKSKLRLEKLMDALTQAVVRKENRVGSFDEIYYIIDKLNAEVEKMK